MAPNTARSLAWDDFRLINAIAATGTLPAAAAALGLDHSTVFRRLRQVEAVMGTPVFERHRGGYVPTAAGVEIAALAARVDEDITAVLRRVAGQSPSPAGEVRIATSDTLLFDLVLPMLAEFKRSCPDVRLDLVTGNTALNLSRRDADVAIRATARPPETLVGRKAGRIAWAPYGTAPLPGPADEGALFAAGVAWVGFGDALAGLAAAAHLRGRVPEHQVACRFDSVAGLVAGVAAGLGHGFLPCIAGDRHPGLVRLGPPLAGLSADLWLLTHPDLRYVPRVRVLLDFLGQRMLALRPRLEGVAESQVT
jgi:molybdate transport repressor ModE-like protein